MTLEIREVTPEAITYLGGNLRSADEVEARLLTGLSPEEAIRYSVDSSIASYVGYFDGVPGGIFGLAHLTDTVGVPWMLGTDLMSLHTREWLKRTPEMLEWMHNHYPCLTNIVHEKNTRSIRWLRSMGFQFEDKPDRNFPSFIQFYRYNNV